MNRLEKMLMKTFPNWTNIIYFAETCRRGLKNGETYQVHRCEIEYDKPIFPF